MRRTWNNDGIQWRVAGAWAEVVEDDYEEGLLPGVANQFDITDVEKMYNTPVAACKAVCNWLGFDFVPSGWDASDDMLCTSFMVNNDNEEPSSSEYEAWQEGKGRLWSMDVYLRFEKVLGTSVPSEDELRSFLR
jgi:hypothetical protein